MASSYSNFFSNSNNFGINVKTTETNAQQQQHLEKKNNETLHNFLKPVEKLVGTMKDVFNGNVAEELNKYRAMNFTTELVLHEADVKVNGQKPVFDMKF